MIVRSPAALGAAIRDRRRQLKLEQRTLAEKVGVSRHWVINVEKGKPGAEIGSIFRTLRVLGILLDTKTESASPGKLVKPDVDLGALIDAARKPRR